MYLTTATFLMEQLVMSHANAIQHSLKNSGPCNFLCGQSDGIFWTVT